MTCHRRDDQHARLLGTDIFLEAKMRREGGFKNFFFRDRNARARDLDSVDRKCGPFMNEMGAVDDFRGSRDALEHVIGARTGVGLAVEGARQSRPGAPRRKQIGLCLVGVIQHHAKYTPPMVHESELVRRGNICPISRPVSEKY